jgi:hypothetical protein
MDREEAKKVFKKLAASYPNWKVDAGIAESWVDDLETEDAETVWANVNEYKRDNKWPPALYDIIKPNADVEARRDKERTRAKLEEREQLAANIPGTPPWERAGMTREDWMHDIIKKHREKEEE